MSQALPITGRPRIDQFKDLANCLRDILGELPDQDDITDALNVSVKLDRMLEFVGSFPSSESLTEMARQVAALDARFASLQAQVALTQRMLTTENRDIVIAQYPMWRNETWCDIGEPLTEATTDVSVKAKSRAYFVTASGYGYYGTGMMDFGIVRAGETDVQVLTDPVTVGGSTNTEVVIDLPDRLPAGAQLKMRSRVPHDFTDPPTARRVRVNTRHTQWGGHVYCYSQSHEEGTVAYSWEYTGSSGSRIWEKNTRWRSISSQSSWRDEFPGYDGNWLCLPSERNAYVHAVRCKVTFTRQSDGDVTTLYSPVVLVQPEVHPAMLDVAAVIFS